MLVHKSPDEKCIFAHKSPDEKCNPDIVRQVWKEKF